jgi:hypothetical protein
VRDVGDRLDVRKTDDRDIEAALKIAAKKFDIDKGLLLTGDTPSKSVQRKFLAIGLPTCKTQSLKYLRAWMKGKQVTQGIERARIPHVEAGITGDPAKNLTRAPAGKSLLRADQERWTCWPKSPVAGIDMAGRRQDCHARRTHAGGQCQHQRFGLPGDSPNRQG